MSEFNSNEQLNVGLAMLRDGSWDAASECLSAVVAHEPLNSWALNGLGIIARQRGEWVRAIALLERALDARPDFAEAYCNLGNALRDGGWPLEAIRCFQTAIQLQPALNAALVGLGICQLETGNATTAINTLRAAVRQQPQSAIALGNLGNALLTAGEPLGAIDTLRAAVALCPTSAELHCNLARAMREAGEISAAINHAEQALHLSPHLAEAHNTLGLCRSLAGDLDGALRHLEAALRIKPDQESYSLNLAAAMKQLERTDEAGEIYRQWARRKPHDWQRRLRATATCPVVFASADAMSSYATETLEAWRGLALTAPKLALSSLNEQIPEPPFQLQFFADDVRPWKEAYADIFRGLESHHAVNKLRTDRYRPRIGFVVTRGHEGVFLLSIGEILRRLNEDFAERVVFCPPSSVARVRSMLCNDAIEIVPLPSRFDLAAERIRDQQCNLLHYWEVGTDAMNYFLPFLRLAPLQIASCGTQVTTGIPNVDIYLSSALIEPPDAAAHYSERLVLFDSLFSFRPRQPPRMVRKTRDDFGFAAGEHLYACPQQLGKFHPNFDGLIADILRRDPLGRFVAVEDACGVNARKLKGRFARTLPDVLPRVTFLPRLSPDDYHDLLSAADVLLDPPHFCGSNSTYDSLAVGQPVVTLPSQFQRGRTTLGILRRIGVLDTVANSPTDYARIAVYLGTDSTRRQSLRERLLAARDVLFDDASVIAAHEKTLRALVALL